MSIDAEAVINQLATRIAQLEVDLAVARARIPVDGEVTGEGLTVVEVIDGDKDE